MISRKKWYIEGREKEKTEKFFLLILLHYDLLFFFKHQNYYTLHLDNDEYVILRDMKITGLGFLKCTKEDLLSSPLKWGMAMEIYVLKDKVSSGK